MTVPVPVPLPVTSSWSVADWLDRSYTSPAPGAGADGVITLTLPTVPDNERWQLTHAVIACTSASAAQMRLYLDGTGVANLRDGSLTGVFDVADWPQGLWVGPGRTLIAQWTGCSPGAVATLNLQATVMRHP